MLHVAGMADLDGIDRASLGDQGIEASETEQTGHQLIGAGPVIGVLQQDFADGITDIIDLAIVDPSHANKMLGKICLALDAAVRLLGANGHKTFPHQAAQNLGSGDRLIRSERLSWALTAKMDGAIWRISVSVMARPVSKRGVWL
jgi:hypothetical protein